MGPDSLAPRAAGRASDGSASRSFDGISLVACLPGEAGELREMGSAQCLASKLRNCGMGEWGKGKGYGKAIGRSPGARRTIVPVWCSTQTTTEGLAFDGYGERRMSIARATCTDVIRMAVRGLGRVAIAVYYGNFHI